MGSNIGRLSMSVKKRVEWIVFSLPDGKEIKMAIDNASCGNNQKAKVTINCDKSIKIKRIFDDGFGNK